MTEIVSKIIENVMIYGWAILLLVLACAFIYIIVNLTPNVSSYTKAVCNYDINYCVDMLITCEDGVINGMEPLGDGVFYPVGWEDPRPQEVIDRWC